eukprot:7577036-Pyramimonas_sp.AAC.1
MTRISWRIQRWRRGPARRPHKGKACEVVKVWALLPSLRSGGGGTAHPTESEVPPGSRHSDGAHPA